MADENTMDSGVPLGPNGLRRVIIGPDGKALPDVSVAAQPETGLTGAVDKLFGINGQPRYQTWPEKMVREAVAAPGNVLASPTPMTSEDLIEPAQAISALAGGGSLPGVMMNGLEKNALGIVPVAAAKKLKVESRPPSDLLKAVAENTEGASIDADGHLIVNMVRSQHPDQEMSESVRGGVFYLPKGDKNARHYNGTTNNNYGGAQAIEGETAFKNPLLVKGATGGKAPESAYNQLMGNNKAYQALDADVQKAAFSGSKNMREELVSQFLEKHAPEMQDYAGYIIENSSKGNQLRYALQEAAIASAARQAGHDGILGYSELRGANSGKQRISEIYDVRENRYPSPSGEYNVHPQFLSDSAVPSLGIQAIAQSNAPRFYSAVEKQVAAAQPKMSGDQWLSTLGNKPGVKPDEMQYTGLNDFLAGKKSVTREEIQQHLEGNKLKLEEVVKGARPALRPEEQIKLNDLEKRFADGDKTLNYNDSMDLAELRMSAKQQEMASSPSKYSQYQLPGGENYREMLMTLPPEKVKLEQYKVHRQDGHVDSTYADAANAAKRAEAIGGTVKQAEELNLNGGYHSSHWDEPNILAHMRMNDRTIDGKKTLHLEEIQSDWHQQGRKEGYAGELPAHIKAEELALEKQKADLLKPYGDITGILKAIGNGDKQAMSVRAQRFEIESRLKDIAGMRGEMRGTNQGQSIKVPDAPFKKNWHELALKRAIAEAAENGYDRLSWTAGGDHPTNPKNLGQTGEQADAADRGMRGFYDSILPKSVEKLTGQKVQKGELSVSTALKDKNAFRTYARENGHANATDAQIDRMWMTEDNLAKKFMKTEQTKSIHYIDIPQSLRESIVGKGQPLFSAPPMLTPVDHDPFKFTPVEGDPFNPITNKDAA
jgi:hypothetical protein